ncbi:MAG: hypothetical protein ACOCV2_03845, partial [Persicimonas sp.]
LWMALGAADADGIHLLVSEDEGRQWELVELPETLGGEDDDERDEDAARNALVPPQTARHYSGRPRLLNHGEAGLYLTDGAGLWRLAASAIDSKGSPWERIDLTDVEWDREPESQSLPTLLRNYIPAGGERSFEVATVLRDELFVFRRDVPSEPWRQIATLDSADRQLLALPGSERLVMVTADGVYLSEDEGEDWDNIEPPGLPQENARGVAIEALPVEDSAEPVLLLAADNGALYRSENLGVEWNEVREPNGDRGVVTDLTHEHDSSRVWASTSGAGILRSPDGGRNWQTFNDNLEATRPYDIEVDEDDTLLLGSDAGLFRLIGRPTQDNWQMLHDRASTTVQVHPESGAIIVGTTNGGLVRLQADGQSSAAEADPNDDSGDIVYQPSRLRGLDLPPRAIATIEARPDSRHIFAWTLREGPRASVDGGQSWTRMPLNDAFLTALEGASLSNFTTDFGQRVYLVSRSFSDDAPTQLWRSYNDGETWHAVSSFERGGSREELFIERNAEYAPEVLFLAHGDRLAKSLDGGNSWRNLTGPWEDGRILQYEVRGEEHLLVVDQRHSLQLMRVTNTDQDHPDVTTYELEWFDRGPPRDDLRGLAVDDERIYLSTSATVLTGSLPTDQPQLPDGLALIVTLTSTFALVVLAYIVLQWMGRD